MNNIFEQIPNTWLETSSDNIFNILHENSITTYLDNSNLITVHTTAVSVTFEFDFAYSHYIHVIDTILRLLVKIRLRKNKKHNSIIKTTVIKEDSYDYRLLSCQVLGNRMFYFPTREYSPTHILNLANAISKYFAKRTNTYLKNTTTDYIDPDFLKV